MPLTRRGAIAGCGGGLALLMRLPALAQTAYPSRTIKMIVPYPAGGTTDFLGRLVADQLKSGLGATVIVENKPGASTALGAEQVARAEPDGYTLLMATSTTLAINKALQKAAIRSGEGFYAGRAGGRGARHSDAGRRRPCRF